MTEVVASWQTGQAVSLWLCPVHWASWRMGPSQAQSHSSAKPQAHPRCLDQLKFTPQIDRKPVPLSSGRPAFPRPGKSRRLVFQALEIFV